MHKVVLQQASGTEVEAIAECAVQAYSQYITRIGKPPAPMCADFKSLVAASRVVVALIDNTVAGYVVFYAVKNTMLLENVAVLTVHRGKGIGKQLITHVECEARALSLEFVELYTNELMTENLQMYPYLGYTEYDRRH